MSKVLLVNPWNYHEEGRGWKGLKWRNGPYNLILLATILKQHRHDVRVLDLNRELVEVRGDRSRLLREFAFTAYMFDPDLVGVSFMTMQAEEAREIAKVMKGYSLVAGGIHATVCGAQELGYPHTFRGPAECGILKLADGTMIESDREVETLDSLPFPDWSLVDYKFYMRSKWQSLDLLMSRGCTHRCYFCAYSFMEKPKFHSARYLLDEVDYMKRVFNVRRLYITDSSIGNSLRLLEEWCTGMIGKRVEWIANIRADQVTKGILQLMKRAGCICLLYGFESGSDRVLNLMNKGCTAAQNIQAAEMTREAGIGFHASIIKNYPGETLAEWHQTIAMLKHMRAPSLGINNYVALPGSRDWHGNTDWRATGESSSISVKRVGRWILGI